MATLKNKVALVTGVTSGIGKAAAYTIFSVEERFAKNNFTAVIACVSHSLLG